MQNFNVEFNVEKANQSCNNQLNQESSQEDKNYDLAIVGSGVSCAYTLINYILLLQDKLSLKKTLELSEPVKVAILDKSGEFWTGVPYGNRTGKQSLIITSLKEFLPQVERDRFISWLTDNYNSVFLTLEQRPGILTEQWLKSYEAAMIQGNWNELFIPRYVFGLYIKERVEHLIAEAENEGYLKCDLFSADVSNILRNQADFQGYRVEFTTLASENSFLLADKVVLAIGSPPNKLPFVEQFEDSSKLTSPNLASNNDLCFIGNMYEPTQNENLEQVFRSLGRSDTSRQNQVVIIGSNASALETLYSLNNELKAQDLISKFIVISPNGEFPHPIDDNSISPTFVPQYLIALVQSEFFTAEQILAAVKQDVKSALAQNETVNSTYSIISTEVINALNKLSFAEQKLFVIKYGVEIGKFQRRAGRDYLNVVDQLVSQGRLQFLKGKFVKTVSLDQDEVGFEFISAINGSTEKYTEPIKAIINCAGFQDLTKSSSPLIANLIRQEICIPNDSLCGFEMNEDFEASKNLYLMGPLVAGNINSKLKVWHAESCGRIINLSQQLAQVLV